MAEQNKTKSEDSDVSTHSSGDQPNSLSLPSGDSLNGSITLPKLHHYSLPTIDESPNVAFERLCQEHQETGNQQICQICDRIFPNWYKLKQHLYTHADFKPFACSYCDKTFKNYSKKSRHEKTHSGLKPYVCRICNKHVTRSEHLKRHLLTHTDSHPYKCMVCDYRSRRLDCIRYHMKNKHPENDSKILFNHQVVDANDDHPNDASDLLWQQYKETSASDPLPPSLLPSPEPEAKPFENKPKKKKKKKKAAEVNPAGADTFPNYPIPPESQAISQSPQFPLPMPLPSASIMYGFPKLQTSQPTNSRSMLPHADILSSSKSSGKSPMHHSQSPPGHHSSPHGQHSSPQNAGHVLDSSFSDDEGQQYFIGGESSKTKMELPKSKRKSTLPKKVVDASQLRLL